MSDARVVVAGRRPEPRTTVYRLLLAEEAALAARDNRLHEMRLFAMACAVLSDDRRFSLPPRVVIAGERGTT